MIYFDTSYLSKCYLLEDGSVVVRQLASAQQQIACSELGQVELVAAFHRKLREGEIARTEFTACSNSSNSTICMVSGRGCR